MAAYYNEIDRYAAQWLRNLIDAELIPAGDIDTRSIEDVTPSDVAGYRQCHFFAGIAGWSLGARLAGWPDDRELWTGSAPCQPFSVAGKGTGVRDKRHLWPHFFRLIRARRPGVCMGEQVAAAVGKHWLDGVFSDLEGIDYSCRAAVIPACAVNAPQLRKRLWFMAYANSKRREEQRRTLAIPAQLAGSERDGRFRYPRHVAHAYSVCGQISTNAAWLKGRSEPREVAGFSGASWITCHDGKSRRVKPGLCLLANGVPARVGRLRAYGNAIVPKVAAAVIGAYLDVSQR